MEQVASNLDDVIINSQLFRRRSRFPNYEAERNALVALSKTMADSPQMILQRLVETALQLCRAGTAGISLLEKHNGEEIIRWEALAGVYADRRNSMMPRNASPCGTTIERNTTQLMFMAERLFPALKAEPPVVEALHVPFAVEGRPIGTVWVVAHDEGRKFDQEDERIVKTLAQFASAAWQLLKSEAAAEAAANAEKQKARELAVANEALRFQIRDRERAEEKLQQLNKGLEKRVNDHTRELEDAYRKLRESEVLGALGTATAKILHDLTNPLNAILIMIQIQEEYLTHDSAQVHELIADTLKDMREQAARVHALITELKQFSRPSELQLEPVDLAKMVTQVIHEVRSIPQQPSLVEFEQKLSDDLPLVMADKEKLSRVLMNLCKNAIEAMPKGGKLGLRCYMREKNMVLEVEDTGCGIPNDVNIFEPFVTSKPRGWGLGLSIVRQIVSAHNGEIEYKSEDGRGTIFKIYLPGAPTSKLTVQ
jgi:signal transduction histidine kinase